MDETDLGFAYNLFQWIKEDSFGIRVYAYSKEPGIETAVICDNQYISLPYKQFNPGYKFDEKNASPNTTYITIESMSETVKLHIGTFTDCVKMKTVTTDDNSEIKSLYYHYFAKDIGMVLEISEKPIEYAHKKELFTYSIQSPVKVGDKEELPKVFKLKQNYPNPFNPETTIEYAIPSGKSKHVRLNVYDLREALISNLVNEVNSPGVHNVIWDGTDETGITVSSGIYIYQLQTREFTKSNKMLLVR